MSEEDESENVFYDKEELYLELYSLLKDELVDHLKHQNNLMTAGLAAIAVIVGYSLVSDKLVGLAFVPFLIGFLVILNVWYLTELMSIANHLIRIESELSNQARLFNWETESGILGRNQELQKWNLNWNRVPLGGLVIVIGLFYIISILITIRMWNEPQPILQGFFTITQSLLFILYIMFSAFILIICYSYKVHRELHSEELEKRLG